MQQILIIDDSQSVCESMRLTISSAGFEVETAADGAQALRRLQQDNSFSLVITDIFMPEIDGIELVERLKADHPDIKIIAYSAGGMGLKSSEMLEVAKEMGADIIIEKPCTDEKLIGHVKELIGN
jgi:CheY-like chemotaxis protein